MINRELWREGSRKENKHRSTERMKQGKNISKGGRQLTYIEKDNYVKVMMERMRQRKERNKDEEKRQIRGIQL